MTCKKDGKQERWKAGLRPVALHLAANPRRGHAAERPAPAGMLRHTELERGSSRMHAHFSFMRVLIWRHWSNVGSTPAGAAKKPGIGAQGLQAPPHADALHSL